MTTDSKQTHEDFLDHLAPIVDGDEAALDRFADHLADHDEARDLRYDATDVAERIAESGADFDVPADLESRLMVALDARAGEAATVEDPALAAAATAAVAKSAADTAADSENREPDADADSEHREPDADAEHREPNIDSEDREPIAETASREPSSESEPESKHSGAAARSGGTLHRLDKRRAIVAAGVGGVLAVAASVALVVGLSGGDEDPTEQTDYAHDFHATIAELDQGGVTIVHDGELAAAPGAAVAQGATVRTDARSRALLQLSDGSTVALNRDTEVVVGDHGRGLTLKRGEILSDVAHLDQGPNFVIHSPLGEVEVLGTKFLVSVGDEEGSVRVLRGEVAVRSGGGAVNVKTGQEALLASNRAPDVVPATNLAGSVSWSELQPEVGDDVPVPGLGELRAHRPGEREEAERPLALAHHSVKVRIVGNVARTEVEETFRNDGNETLEGVFRFPLPADARIASLSLDVEGTWEDGAFVAKDRARRIWNGVIRNATPEQQRQQQEEFIWVPGPWRDPALLEWQQGGRFELRIFPIPANGERRIRIAYEQTIQPHGDERRYVYPLAHAGDDSTAVGHFEVDVKVAGDSNAKAHGYEMASAREDGSDRLRYSAESFRPAGDLIVDYQMPNGDAEIRWWTFRGDATAPPPEATREDEEVLDEHRQLAQDDRGYVVFALQPELPMATANRARDYVLVVDASQSMVGERYERASRLATALASEMDRRDRVTALTCDVTCRELSGGFRMPNGATAAAIQQFFDKEEPAGASDLVAALGSSLEAAQRLRSGTDRELHLVYIGDGAASVGHRRAGSLGDEMHELLDGKAQLTTVGIGQDADAPALASMARGGGGHYVPFVPGQRSSQAALAVLETTYGASLQSASIEMPEGVALIAPTEMPTIRNGQEILVAARMDRDSLSGDVVLRGKTASGAFEQRYPVTLQTETAAGNAFVPRLWASERIKAMENEGRSENQASIIALSKAYGVMSRETSLLVLESEAMFRAFGVDRARASVQWTGEEDMVYGESEAANAGILGALGGDANIGLGGLGTVGAGRGGGGSAFGYGSTAMSAPRSSSRTAAGPARFRAEDNRNPFDDALAANVRERRRRPNADPAPRPDEPMEEAEPSPDLADATGAETSVDRDEEAARPQQPVTRRRRGPGRWMRKVWFREGRISRDGVREQDMVAVRVAEEQLRASPDSRDRHRDLVRALSRAGHLERAEEIAREWMERDRLDPEALTYLADVVGRRGEREKALRLLSGIVDLQPESRVLQERMANAFERSNQAPRACAHRVALAEIRPNDEDIVAAAVRCERSLGRPEAANRLLDAVPADDRESVRQAASTAPNPESIRGDLMAEATWTGGADVDITLVTPQGTRLSWMGGRTNVVGDDARRIGHERVGLRRAGVGTYYIEVNRVDPNDTTPINGTLEIRARDDRQRIPFRVEGSRTTVGRVSIVRRWRMENR